MRSPGRRLHPLLVWCVIICASVQYSSRNDDRLTICGARLPWRMFAVRISTSTLTSNPPEPSAVAGDRYSSGLGSPDGRCGDAQRNGASASYVTTHGDTVVAKLFERKGPRGWYSHA